MERMTSGGVRRLAAGTLAVLLLPAARGAGQAELRDYTEPILVVGTEGHTAPPRALAFTPDGRALFSAGLDKVVHVWDLTGDAPRLGQTIRPPLWRAHRGSIYAIAVAREPDPEGRYLLAVGGHGADSIGGSILLYRVGVGERPVADLVGVLVSDRREVAADRRAGHADVVHSLAFSPDGRLLASGGADGTALIWDVERRARVKVLTHGAPASPTPVQRVAFSPGGDRLLIGGADGMLRLWDFNGGRTIGAAPTAADVVRGDPNPRAAAVNDLAFSPDGRWIVVGRESGRLIRFRAADLGDPTPISVGEGRGAVDAVAIGPDSRLLAVSVVAHGIAHPAQLPRTECIVELRRLPGGEVVSTLPTFSNVVRTCTFSPDGRYMVAAGGDAQAVVLKDLRAPDRPVIELKGPGTSIRGIAFDATSRVVAFTREAPGAGAGAGDSPMEGFHLADRRFVPVAAEGRRGALTEYEGWSVRPVDLDSLEVIGPDRRVRFRIEVDPVRGRRWWSHTFLPPGPGHGRPALAVGTDGGIVVYRLADGRKTRELAGHGGTVYALAPAPDGRWLASGSVDQTIRLWALAGCDAVPRFGATLRAEGGQMVVDLVEPRSPAAQMGLTAGDRILACTINNAAVPVAEFPGRADSVEPGPLLTVEVRRGAESFSLGTTKRDSPALGLFAGIDREWVVWAPTGYYDTSIAGDSRFLGWHANRIDDRNDFRTLRTSAYFPLVRYEEQLRRPAAIELLVASADPGRAEDLARTPDRIPTPPTVQLTVTEGVVAAPELTVRLRATADQGTLIRSIRLLNGTEEQVRRDLDAPVPALDLADLSARLRDGENRLTARVTDDRGLVGTANVVVMRRRPEPTRRGSALVVRAVGIERFADPDIPPIRFAAADAAAVAEFLARTGRRRGFPAEAIDVAVLPPPDAAGAGVGDLAAIIEELRGMVRGPEESRRLRPGDMVMLFLETHLLNFEGSAGSLLTADSTKDSAASHRLAAGTVAEALGEVASAGCTVVVLLDLIHRRAAPDWPADIAPWVRELGNRRDVVVLYASKDGPSRRLIEPPQGAFSLAVVESVTTVGGAVDPSAPLTLADFVARVEARVAELAPDAQFPGHLFPETVAPGLGLFEPAIRASGD